MAGASSAGTSSVSAFLIRVENRIFFICIFLNEGMDCPGETLPLYLQFLRLPHYATPLPEPGRPSEEDVAFFMQTPGVSRFEAQKAVLAAKIRIYHRFHNLHTLVENIGNRDTVRLELQRHVFDCDSCYSSYGNYLLDRSSARQSGEEQLYGEHKSLPEIVQKLNASLLRLPLRREM